MQRRDGRGEMRLGGTAEQSMAVSGGWSLELDVAAMHLVAVEGERMMPTVGGVRGIEAPGRNR